MNLRFSLKAKLELTRREKIGWSPISDHSKLAYRTVWKYHSFSIIQIFTWNKFWGFWKCKISHSNTFRDSEIWFFLNFCSFWMLKFTKLTQFKAAKIAKTAVLELLLSPKLISRKIWTLGKSWYFYTVLTQTIDLVLFSSVIDSHNVEIPGFFCLSHLRWNQFWRI